ncbi:MAG: type III pantothenate kinase [Sedimentisphaerales bacterium]|nr:type III pantothenate kinase [Sedimentisphaerales bacterium]
MDAITIDIGNSTISIAVFTGQKHNRTETIPIEQADTRKLSDILRAFREICGPQPLNAKTVPVVVSSVNSTILELIERSVGDVLDQNILLIGREFPLEMKVAVENPDTIGSDRLLTAFAAYQVVESAVVVADFGTATTIDCVNDNGIFLGGVILPGLNLSARSLSEYTAALPCVTPKLPTDIFGVNTETAIQNGIYFGAIGAFREIVERYAEQLGQWPQIVATGGFSKLILRHCDFIDSHVPDLCLDGLYLAYCRYRDSLKAAKPL